MHKLLLYIWMKKKAQCFFPQLNQEGPKGKLFCETIDQDKARKKYHLVMCQGHLLVFSSIGIVLPVVILFLVMLRIVKTQCGMWPILLLELKVQLLMVELLGLNISHKNSPFQRSKYTTELRNRTLNIAQFVKIYGGNL